MVNTKRYEPSVTLWLYMVNTNMCEPSMESWHGAKNSGNARGLAEKIGKTVYQHTASSFGEGNSI